MNTDVNVNQTNAISFEVRKAYNNTFDRSLPNEAEVQAFIARKANKLNFGMYRWWTDPTNANVRYFDCGPTTYVVREMKGGDH